MILIKKCDVIQEYVVIVPYNMKNAYLKFMQLKTASSNSLFWGKKKLVSFYLINWSQWIVHFSSLTSAR